MCDFCNEKAKRIKNGYTYGNARIKNPLMEIIACILTTAEMNMETDSLK